MRSLTRMSLAALACVFLWAATAPAAPVYSFRFDEADLDYQVAPDGTVDVKVYLNLKGDLADNLATTQQFAMIGGGLKSAGVRLSYTGATPNTATLYTVPDAESNIANNPAFDEVDKYVGAAITAIDPLATNPIAGISELRLLGGVTPTTVTPNIEYELLLGTFTFKAGSTPGEVTTITAQDLFADQEDTIAYSLDDEGQLIDALLQAAPHSTATITVVPEPPSLVAFAGLVLSGGAMWVVRRRRAKAAA